MSCTRVDLLEPVPPRMPTVMPESMCRLMSCSANFFACAEYLKLTFSKSMEPSFTFSAGEAGSVSAGSSSSTSQIRTKDSYDIVIIT